MAITLTPTRDSHNSTPQEMRLDGLTSQHGHWTLQIQMDDGRIIAFDGEALSKAIDYLRPT